MGKTIFMSISGLVTPPSDRRDGGGVNADIKAVTEALSSGVSDANQSQYYSREQWLADLAECQRTKDNAMAREIDAKFDRSKALHNNMSDGTSDHPLHQSGFATGRVVVGEDGKQYIEAEEHSEYRPLVQPAAASPLVSKPSDNWDGRLISTTVNPFEGNNDGEKE